MKPSARKFRHEEEEKKHCSHGHGKTASRRLLLASDALPLPVWLTNKVFLALFFSISYFLMRRWREKIRNSTPLHIVSFSEIVALVAFVASVIYLLGFFGIAYVQMFVNGDERSGFTEHGGEEGNPKRRIQSTENPDSNTRPGPSPSPNPNPSGGVKPRVRIELGGRKISEMDDDDIAIAVSSGLVPAHALEGELENDCTRAALIRRKSVEISTGRTLLDLPLHGFDYSSAVGQCCEMMVGYVQIPVGVAGPLLLDGSEYTLPLATTEGTLVASTNRGLKAIRLSGGATSTLLRDGMTRAPVLRFTSAQRAAELKFYVEDPSNLVSLCEYFNSTSRFARLQNIQCALAGRNVYMRFTCSTGDAMGMNMVTKAVQNVLTKLQRIFFDMEVVSISGNFCADKKATAVNWIEGRGKSVVCEAVITGDVISSVFKTSASALAELNTVKNLTGSAIAGALGGFNAHASNIVTAIFIATGQDPAQNVESSHCMTLMEVTNGGQDLHVSVTMPCVEVGTIGGGTKLAAQATCLDLLGVKGPNYEIPGANAQRLARIVAGAVLAGELSLMAAQTTGELVRSHMKYNRSSNNICLDNILEDSVKKGQ